MPPSSHSPFLQWQQGLADYCNWAERHNASIFISGAFEETGNINNHLGWSPSVPGPQAGILRARGVAKEPYPGDATCPDSVQPEQDDSDTQYELRTSTLCLTLLHSSPHLQVAKLCKGLSHMCTLHSGLPSKRRDCFCFCFFSYRDSALKLSIGIVCGFFFFFLKKFDFISLETV